MEWEGNKLKKNLVALCMVLMMGILITSGCEKNDYEDIYTGNVEADSAQINNEVGGILEEVYVKEGQVLNQDTVIGRLNVEELKLEREKLLKTQGVSQAKVDKLRAGTRPEEIKKAESNIKKQEAYIAGLNKDLEYRKKELERSKSLYESNAISLQNLDDSQALYDKSEALINTANGDLEYLKNQLALLKKGERVEDIKIATKDYSVGAASIDMLDYKISKEFIKIKDGGYLETLNFSKGEYIKPYSSIGKIVYMDKLWMKIYVPEKKLSKVSLGQSVKLSGQGLKKSITGKVIFISTQGEFTPKNIESRENKEEIVYAVKIEIPEGNKLGIKPGMLMDVDLGGRN